MNARIALPLVAALALLVAAAPVTADEAEPEVIRMRAVSEGDGHYFEVDGERNPTLALDAGKTYRIDLEIEGTHNIAIGEPVSKKTEPQSGGEQSLTFTIPADFAGEIAYVCDPHQFFGMQGTIQVAGDNTTDPGSDGTTGDGGDGTTGDDTTGDGDTTDNTSGDDVEESTKALPAPATALAAFAVAGAALLSRRR